jgi:hypothetical protein
MATRTDGTPFGQLRAKTVGEVRETYQPGDEAILLLTDDMAPRDYFLLLRERRLSIEAASFLAHALPRREAIWWCSRCARLACPEPMPPAVRTAITAAEEWAKTTREEYCRSAQTVLEATGASETPAGCVALATLWSGPNLAPPGLSPVAPAKHMAPNAVFGAVIRSAGWNDPDRLKANLEAMLDLGVAIADGTNRWPEPSSKG